MRARGGVGRWIKGWPPMATERKEAAGAEDTSPVQERGKHLLTSLSCLLSCKVVYPLSCSSSLIWSNPFLAYVGLRQHVGDFPGAIQVTLLTVLGSPHLCSPCLLSKSEEMHLVIRMCHQAHRVPQSQRLQSQRTVVSTSQDHQSTFSANTSVQRSRRPRL